MDGNKLQALIDLQHALIAAEEHLGQSGDRMCDFFSDVLHDNGLDIEQFDDLCFQDDN